MGCRRKAGPPAWAQAMGQERGEHGGSPGLGPRAQVASGLTGPASAWGSGGTSLRATGGGRVKARAGCEEKGWRSRVFWGGASATPTLAGRAAPV